MSRLRRWWRLLGTETWVEWRWADQIGLVPSEYTRVTQHRGVLRYWWRAR